MLEFSFDISTDFLDFTSPKHYNVAINVSLLAVFWWFGGCAFALLIHSFGSLHIGKSYDVCVKTTWKIIIKIPSRCHQNAGNGLQKSKLSWGGHGPTPPPRWTRLWRVAFGKRWAWHAKPPWQKSGSAPEFRSLPGLTSIIKFVLHLKTTDSFLAVFKCHFIICCLDPMSTMLCRLA